MKARDLAKSARNAAAMQLHGQNEALEHFGTKYPVIDYKGRKVYLFGHEREFGKQRHSIAFHPTCSPSIPEHVLSYVLITYCLSGRFPLVVDGRPAALASGECVVLDRQVPHFVEETSGDDIAVHIILAEEFFDGFMLDGIAALASPFATALTTLEAPHDEWRLYHTTDDEVVRTCMERMRHASLMLRGTSQPIYDIAQAVGLANLTSFYQRFREYYGCTPKEYRDAQ